MRMLLIFSFIINVSCSGQTVEIDTVLSNKFISAIDNPKPIINNLGKIVVRKYLHNETQINHEFLIDTLSYQLYKCEYLSLAIEPRNDSTLEKTSFYVNDIDFVAVVFEKYHNSVVLISTLSYLKATSGDIKSFFPINKTDLTRDEIKYRAKELWLTWESLKGSKKGD